MEFIYNPLEDEFNVNKVDSVTEGRITAIENTQIKIAYYAEITTTSGQISLPGGSTVLLDQWENGIDCLISKINSNKPDYEDTGILCSFDINGNYSFSESLPSSPSALIYYISIAHKDLHNLNQAFIIEQVEVSEPPITSHSQLSDLTSDDHLHYLYLEGRSGQEIQDSLKIGDVAGGNYFEIEPDGSHISKGNATVYDDLANNASSFLIEGSNPPIMKYFINDGSGGVDNARSFNGVADYGIIPQLTISPIEFSVNVWLKPDDLEGQILYIPTFLDLYFSGGNLTADWDGVYTQQASTQLSQNAWSMLTLTTAVEGTRLRMKMYINSVLHKENRRTGSLNTNSGDTLVAKYTNSSWFNKSVYDELSTFDKPLTQIEVDELYNSGNPTGILPSTTLANTLSHFKFNEVGGYIIVNEVDSLRPMALYINDGVTGVVSIVNGVVGNSGSKGIALPHWSPTIVNEIHISAQTPHARKEATDFLQHIHILKVVDDVGWICFALEYIGVGLTQILGNTIITRAYLPVIGNGNYHQHTLMEFMETVDGSNLGISSSFIGRLWRDVDWEDANNGLQVADYTNPLYGTVNYIPATMDVTFIKYTHDIIVLASDAHIEIDSDGSREPYLK